MKREKELTPHPAKEYTESELAAILLAGIIALLAPYWCTALAMVFGVI